jgi:hypothetical protein
MTRVRTEHHRLTSTVKFRALVEQTELAHISSMSLVRRSSSLICALGLTLLGLGGTYYVLIYASQGMIFLVVGTGVMGFLGLYWFWAEFIAPIRNRRTTRAP